MKTRTPAHIVACAAGEVRSLTARDPGHVRGVEIDNARAVVEEIEALDQRAYWEMIIEEFEARVLRARFLSRGWEEVATNLYSITRGEVALTASQEGRRLDLRVASRRGREPLFECVFGEAVGVRAVELMLDAWRASKKGSQLVLTPDEIERECMRREARLLALLDGDPTRLGLGQVYDELAWCMLPEAFEKVESGRLEPAGRPEPFCTYKATSQGRIYTPYVAILGSLQDECSLIYKYERDFTEMEKALDVARSFANRRPAHIRWGGAWTFLCTGKQWCKYSGAWWRD